MSEKTTEISGAELEIMQILLGRRQTVEDSGNL